MIRLTDSLQLLNITHRLELESEDLDELVHDISSAHASAINNQGLENQIEFLLKELGYNGAESELSKIANAQPKIETGEEEDEVT